MWEQRTLQNHSLMQSKTLNCPPPGHGAGGCPLGQPCGHGAHQDGRGCSLRKCGASTDPARTCAGVGEAWLHRNLAWWLPAPGLVAWGRSPAPPGLTPHVCEAGWPQPCLPHRAGAGVQLQGSAFCTIPLMPDKTQGATVSLQLLPRVTTR